MWTYKSDLMLLKEIGEKIKRERIFENLTQEELASKSGVGIATIQRLENGTSVSVRSLLSVMRVLRMIDRLSLAFPDRYPSPIQMMQNNGNERQRIRK